MGPRDPGRANGQVGDRRKGAAHEVAKFLFAPGDHAEGHVFEHTAVGKKGSEPFRSLFSADDQVVAHSSSIDMHDASAFVGAAIRHAIVTDI